MATRWSSTQLNFTDKMCLRGSSENLHVVERLSRIDEGDHALGEILRGARLGERETQK